MKIVSFCKFKKKSDNKIKRIEKIRKLHKLQKKSEERASRIKNIYKERQIAELLRKIETLERKHAYDIFFINLLDNFMTDEYPEYNDKFNLWYDKMIKILK